MKQLSKNLIQAFNGLIAKVMLTLSMLGLNLIAFAQEEGLDIEVSVNEEPAWYTNIWIWIGLAVFIIIIVAIVSAGRRR